MEKVENLYRTARAQNDSIDTSDKSDHACAIRCIDGSVRRDRSTITTGNLSVARHGRVQVVRGAESAIVAAAVGQHSSRAPQQSCRK